MDFIKIADSIDSTGPLRDGLLKELQAGKRVLWLLSGGSNITLTAHIMRDIPKELSSNLTMYMSDERYGPVGHRDSNMQQLLAAGFEPKQATVIPVLRPHLSLEETRQQFEHTITGSFASNDTVIGQLGMGPDGHIAGILPHSPAVTASELVCTYQATEYTRITMTFPALAKLDAAYLYAFGDNKRAALQQLRDETMPPSEQPAQFLKTLPYAVVINDQIGDTA
jgi:6-phosphogluconolactonase